MLPDVLGIYVMCIDFFSLKSHAVGIDIAATPVKCKAIMNKYALEIHSSSLCMLNTINGRDPPLYVFARPYYRKALCLHYPSLPLPGTTL